MIAESYERIHRSNLLMMGILPLQFMDGENAESLGLSGREEFAIEGVENGDAHEVTVRADDREFRARVRLDTPREREYLQPRRHPAFVLRRLPVGVIWRRVAPCDSARTGTCELISTVPLFSRAASKKEHRTWRGSRTRWISTTRQGDALAEGERAREFFVLLEGSADVFKRRKADQPR